MIRSILSCHRSFPPRRHLPPPHGHVAIGRVQFHRETPPPSALGGDDLGAGAAERLIDQVTRIRKRRQHRLGQRHREQCRVLSRSTQTALVAHDPDHAVRKAEALDRVAAAGIGVDCAVVPAQNLQLSNPGDRVINGLEAFVGPWKPDA
jgi:hypothetical protein